MPFTIYHNNTPIKCDFKTEKLANSFIPILKAQDKKNHITRKFHVREVNKNK